MQNKIPLLLLGLSAILTTGSITHAQGTGLTGVAYHVPIESIQEVQDGHIISIVNGIYQLSEIENDNQIYGVVTEKPSLELNTYDEETTTYPVLTNGEAEVLVNDSNGEIQKGDLITSSTTAGVGIKSISEGYILGQALENLEGTDGKILVAIHPAYPTSQEVENNNLSPVAQLEKLLSGLLNFENLSKYQTPDRTFRYLLALIIFVSSLILASLSFGRTARSGIESIGRNPLASRTIILGIIFNVLVTIAIIAAGGLISLYILSL